MSAAESSVEDVIARLRGIDDELPGGDGAAVFNHMYLTVTEAVAEGLRGARVFDDPAFMERLDVAFASLWLEAYDAPSAEVPKAWVPLFESRSDRSLLPVQFALAGMNSHIEHDLPVAVIRTCRDLNTSPHAAGVHEDFEAVTPLISSWNIDKARDVAWVNVEILWAMRHVESLADRYQASLARTVGMTSRSLLTPVLPA